MKVLEANENNFIKIDKEARSRCEPLLFPTDTIYGIGAPVEMVEANKRIFDIKNRPEKMPFPIIIGSISQLFDLIDQEVDEEILKILEINWPGPCTFIFKAKKDLPDIYKYNETVAVRMPALSWLRNALVQTGAYTATSANLSGEDYDGDFTVLSSIFSCRLNLALNAGDQDGEPSALVDLSGTSFKIIRKGQFKKV